MNLGSPGAQIASAPQGRPRNNTGGRAKLQLADFGANSASGNAPDLASAQIPNPMSRLLRPPSTTRTTPEGPPAAPASWQPRRSAPPGRDHSQTPAIRLDRLPVPMDVRSPGLGASPALWNIGSNPVLHSGLGSRHGLLPPSICASQAQMTLFLPSIEPTATINGPVANGAAGSSWRGGPTPHTRLRTSRLTEGPAVACPLAAQKSAGASFDPGAYRSSCAADIMAKTLKLHFGGRR